MRRWIKSLFLMLTVVLLLGLLTTAVLAAEVTVLGSGACGENLTWTLTSDGVLTISGTGEMDNYTSYIGSRTSKPVPWKQYMVGSGYSWSCPSVKKIVIEEGVTGIGSYAFSEMVNLKSVSLPESLTGIGKYSFYDCKALSAAAFPEGLQRIGAYAFYRSKLTHLTLPSGITKLESYTFGDCQTLATVRLPAALETIGSNAFYHCTALREIAIPDTVQSIGFRAFYHCSSLQELTIPDSVTAIGSSAFAYCLSLEQITLPSQLPQVNSSLLSHCESLTSLELPQTVTQIDRYAFSSCRSLKKIVIPASVTRINRYAFCNCKVLKKVEYQGTPEQWEKINLDPYKNYNLLRAISYQLPFCTASLSYYSYLYTGEPVTPVPTIHTRNGIKLKADSNYTVSYQDNVECGTGTVVLTGIGKYSGTVTLPFQISRYIDLSECKISTQYKTYGCTGQAVEPNLRVRTRWGTRLTAGEHYSVRFENNVDCGTATAIVTGINGNTGTLRYTFQIRPAKIKNLTVVTRTRHTLKLSWTPAPVATCYRVYLNGSLTGETSGSSILLTQLYARSTYTVKVQAVISTTDASGKKVDYYGISASVRTSTL